MAEDWASVGKAISARLGELGMTQLDLAAASKVSPATIREIQYNRIPRRRNPRTLQALSEALGWPDDHLTNLLQGRGESPADAAGPPTRAELESLRDAVGELNDRLARLEAQAQHRQHAE
jgi:transcriptional regulator with XRE-family HTH domain